MFWPSHSGRHGEHLLLCLSRCCCRCATKWRPHQSTAMRSVYLGVLIASTGSRSPSSGQAAARRHAGGVGSAEAGTGAAWGACLSDAADAERLHGEGRTEEIRIVPFCPTALNIFTTRQATLAGRRAWDSRGLLRRGQLVLGRSIQPFVSPCPGTHRLRSTRTPLDGGTQGAEVQHLHGLDLLRRLHPPRGLERRRCINDPSATKQI
mmetsp:Transcript_127779/g.409157  ORF Transcript_127779/g.409157 Transcript_127779/m.409157 type:complete len:207 (+) Transcript_127779:472-1092(+)